MTDDAPPSDADFDQHLLVALGDHPDVESVDRRDDDTLRVRRAGGLEVTVSLAQLRREYRSQPPDERERYLAAVVACAAEPTGEDDAPFDEVAPRLMPTIRNASLAWMLALRARAQEPEAGEGLEPWPLMASPLCEGLVVVPVEDGAHTMSTLTLERAERWGVPEQAVYRRALDNLRAASPHPPESVAPGVFASTYQDAYDSSRALLADWVATAGVPGPHLVSIPQRGALLIASQEDAAGLLALTEQVFLGAGRSISAQLYRPGEGRLTPYRVGPEDRLYDALRRARMMDLVGQYEDQKGLLDSIHEAEEVHLDVAAFTAVQDGKGVPTSSSVWVEGVETLLPESEQVTLELSGNERLTVSWEALLQGAARHLEAYPGLEPVRWRTRGFPGGEALAALRARAQRD